MNKNIDKNAYQKPKTGKHQLTIVSLVILILSLCTLILGVVLIVRGIIVAGIASKIWRIVLGGLLALLGVIFSYASFMALFTSFAMLKNDSMNVKDGNSAIGTLNVLKCDRCGYEVQQGANHCNHCGASLEDFIECECGTRNPKDAEHCSNCGKKLK